MKKLLLLIYFFSVSLMANELPELGSSSDTIFSSADEDKISKQILYQVNKNPLVVKDSEIDDYLSHLGRRLMNGTSLANKNTKFFGLA